MTLISLGTLRVKIDLLLQIKRYNCVFITFAAQSIFILSVLSQLVLREVAARNKLNSSVHESNTRQLFF